MANIPLTTFTWVPKSIYSTKIYQDLSFIMIYHHLQRSWSKISKFFRTRATSLPALPAGWRRQRTRHVQPMGRRHGWHDWHGHRGRNQRRLMDCHGAMIERSYLKLLKQILRIVCLFHDQNGICWILLICNMLWLYIYNIILYIYFYYYTISLSIAAGSFSWFAKRRYVAVLTWTCHVIHVGRLLAKLDEVTVVLNLPFHINHQHSHHSLLVS
jgi:hypothetical protein